MKLSPVALRPFTHGEIKPRGWLRRQLEIQADGLSGNLDKIWPDIRDSQWIGGDRDGWERVPYWLDGFIPLAYLLEDADKIARARRYVDGILSAQEEDGWICPCPKDARGRYDMWACILIAKVLALYADLSGDDRIEGVLTRVLRNLQDHIDKNTLFNWASARWFEALIPIFWLYERTGGEWLLELARRMEIQGIDYDKLFSLYLDGSPRREWTFLTHVVNLAMCLKQGALKSRLYGGDPEAFAAQALATLRKHHGMAVGHFTGDECVNGDSPVQGTELCGVVEAMYSYETLLSVSGSPRWADELERLAFNALPATMSADMWTHQYDQMSNQIRCQRLPEDHVVFGTNGPESHLFGLEPNFGCCTANFNQAWPKLAMHTFLRQGEDTLVSAVLAPSVVHLEIGGAQVECELSTEYPFRGRLEYRVKVDRPVDFALSLRIPGFAKAATVAGQAIQPGRFHALRRTWEGESRIVVDLSFETEIAPRPREMYALWRGPLLFALPIDEYWEKHEYTKDGVERKFPYCDYEITPRSPWNFAFSAQDFEGGAHKFEVEEHPLSGYPYATEAPPVTLTVPMVQVAWPEAYGVCAVEPADRTALTPPRPVRMIPYGCTQLRMTELPKSK